MTQLIPNEIIEAMESTSSVYNYGQLMDLSFAIEQAVEAFHNEEKAKSMSHFDRETLMQQTYLSLQCTLENWSDLGERARRLNEEHHLAEIENKTKEDK